MTILFLCVSFLRLFFTLMTNAINFYIILWLAWPSCFCVCLFCVCFSRWWQTPAILRHQMQWTRHCYIYMCTAVNKITKEALLTSSSPKSQQNTASQLNRHRHCHVCLVFLRRAHVKWLELRELISFTPLDYSRANLCQSRLISHSNVSIMERLIT